MTIHHFNTYLSGGAAIAARQLHHSLLATGVDSRFYYGPEVQRPGDPTYLAYEPDAPPRNLAEKVLRHVARLRLRRSLRRYVQDRPAGSDLFTYAKLHYPTPRPVDGPGPDVIHLHWIADFLDYRSFFASIPDELPIVWTLHDMNAFTGGCHYVWNCAKFQSGCQHCPQLAHPAANDLSSENFRIKRAAFQGKNIHVVANSRWMEEQARHSALFTAAKSFRTIYYGLDMNVFRPLDKTASRSQFGIPADRFVICFGAETMDIPRKGFKELLEALAILPNCDRITCLVFGTGTGWPNRRGLPEIKQLGPLPHGEAQTPVYSAADLFVIPSLQEAFGQTCLEAMACGTPVIGFNTGGIPEMISDGQTGLLAQPGDARDLAAKIQWMIDHREERLAMGARARRFAAENFTPERQAQGYRQLYETIASAGTRSTQ